MRTQGKPQVRCTVCRSEHGAEINRALCVEGVSLRETASRYPELSFPAIARHSRNCLARRREQDARPRAPRVRAYTAHVPAPQTSCVTSDPLDDMEREWAQAAQEARERGDIRSAERCDLMRLKVKDAQERERDKARAQDSTRERALSLLAALPSSFVQKLRDDDDEAFQAMENALSGGAEGVESTEAPNAIGDGDEAA